MYNAKKLIAAMMIFILIFPFFSCSANNSTHDIPRASESIIESPNHIFYMKVDREYDEWLTAVPDRVLAGSTSELFDFFLNSPFLSQTMFCGSEIKTDYTDDVIDFTYHKAFKEFIARHDLPDVLESYAKTAICNSEDDNCFLDIELQYVLAQPAIEEIMARTSYADYPYLHAFDDMIDNADLLNLHLHK